MTAVPLLVELPPCLSGGTSYPTPLAAHWVLLWARRQRRLRTPPRRAYRCALGRHWHLTRDDPHEGGPPMSGSTYWRAPEVERIAEKLIHENHDHLLRDDVTVRCVFRDPPAKSRGKTVYGKARKIGGLNAHLVGLDLRDESEPEPVDFFVIEIAAKVWEHLTHPQRIALVDHELCHLDVQDADDPDQHRKLSLVGHDLEEFTAIVERHGLWRPSVESFVKADSAQLELPLD